MMLYLRKGRNFYEKPFSDLLHKTLAKSERNFNGALLHKKKEA